MKLVKEHINEKFTEDSDPIADMNIGMIHQIKKWMKSKGYEYEDKDNTLITCAIHGKTEFVRYLLDAAADVHADNDKALRWASMNGHTEVVKLLLEAGADVHAQEDEDEALRWASMNGHTKVVKILLDAGANVHAQNDYSLMWASYNGHTEVVKLLLDAGANVHASNDYALRYASYRRHTEVVKILLVAGADVHADNDHALRYASNNGHTEVVKLLKDHIAKEKKLKNKIKESLNEKFTDDSDPITDMGIGNSYIIKQSIKKIFKKDSSYDHYYSYRGYWQKCYSTLRGINIINKSTSDYNFKEKNKNIYYILEFYSDEFKNFKNSNNLNKLKYAEHLVKYANMNQYFENNILLFPEENEIEGIWAVAFIVKSEYKNIFSKFLGNYESSIK